MRNQGIQILTITISIPLLLLCGCATSKIKAPEKVSTMGHNLDVALNSLTMEIASKATDVGKRKIAVVEFSDLNGNITDFGRYLSEELITRLFNTEKFEVVERQLLNKIMQEQKLSLTGLVDPKSAKELGLILGVDAIVSGTITDLTSFLKVNARIISAQTGTISSVASVEIAKDEAVIALMSRLSKGETMVGPKSPISPGVSGGTAHAQFTETFDDALTSNWKVVSGDWVIVEDRQPDGTIGPVCEQRTPNEMAILLATPGYDWVDYTLEADVKTIEGRRPLLIVRTQDKPHYYYIWFFAEAELLAEAMTGREGHKLRYQHGESSENISGRVENQLQTGRWYHLKVQVIGAQIKCYLDNSLVHDVSHGAFYKGTIGIGTNSCTAHFDNIRVTLK